MPIYEYKCENCEHKFESYNPYMNEDKMECPECGSPSCRSDHFESQKLRNPGYTMPPKFGQRRKGKW